MELSDKHILVTGAAKRLGRAIAEFFVSEGARVSAHYHSSRQEIENFVQKAPAGKVNPIKANLEDLNSIPILCKKAQDHFGPVDILINSAGVFPKTPAATLTEEDWESTLKVNLKAPFYLAQGCFGSDLGKRHGLVIQLVDIFGKKPLKNFLGYGTSKAGVLMMVKILAQEWAPHIRVNAICPGAVLLPEFYSEDQIEKAKNRTLLKRLGSPLDIVEATRFICENDYLTGAEIVVDGGQSI